MKRMTIITGLAILMLAGCEALLMQADDPNSALSKTVEATGHVGEGITTSAPAAGPYGWIAAAVGTALTGIAGAYKVRQKNATIKTDGAIITAQQREFNMIRDTTKAIVDAIEQVGNVGMGNGDTIGSTVKAQVSEELKKRGLDTMGKAIISGIKASRTEAQKVSS